MVLDWQPEAWFFRDKKVLIKIKVIADVGRVLL